jgi:hypothetical protein
MYGFGIQFILGRVERNNSGRLSFSRPLQNIYDLTVTKQDPTDETLIADKWDFIERRTQNDKFLIGFFRKYGKLIY